MFKYYTILNVGFENSVITYYILVVLYGCETTCFTLTEEQKLKAFENEAVLTFNIFGIKRDEIQQNGESYIILNYMHCTLHLAQLGNLN